MNNAHIVKSFDDDLKKLAKKIQKMGKLTSKNLENAFLSLKNEEHSLASYAIENDDAIDQLEESVYKLSVQMLALRQPMADDLRYIIAAMKVATDIERIGDYASGLAKRVTQLDKSEAVPFLNELEELYEATQDMLKKSIKNIKKLDVKDAVDIWKSDDIVDQLHTNLTKDLIKKMESDSESVAMCTQLLFIVKNMERIGDHLTNVCESIYYAVKGKSLEKYLQKA